jgi:hypothetical protein
MLYRTTLVLIYHRPIRLAFAYWGDENPYFWIKNPVEISSPYSHLNSQKCVAATGESIVSTRWLGFASPGTLLVESDVEYTPDAPLALGDA